MEVVNTLSNVNVIRDNYIINLINTYLLDGFLICVAIISIVHIFNTLIYIRDQIDTITETKLQINRLEEKLTTELNCVLYKINEKLFDISNNVKENETEINKNKFDITLLYNQSKNNKKIIEVIEKNVVDNFKTFMENLKKNQQSNEDFVDKNIKDFVNRYNERFSELHEKINEVSNQTIPNLEIFQNKINKLTTEIEKQSVTMNDMNEKTNKNIEKLSDELRNKSSGYNLIPVTAGSHGFCDINSEKMIFNCIMDLVRASQIHLCIDDVTNIMIYDITRCRPYINGDNILTGPFKFLEQFKNIKSLYFEFNGVCTNENIPSAMEFVLYKLFHKITEINPSIDIYYKCKDINPSSTPGILREFLKTNKYKSFHLEVENNFTKDLTSGNLRYIKCNIGENIKEHCLTNNITFVSNIDI
jgi:hypothetical protein